MTEAQVTSYVAGLAATVIFGLIAVLWGVVKNESKANADALATKASADALREAKQDFTIRLDKQQSDYQQRLQEVSQRQDKEIDWLKEEMDKISNNIDEMRKEISQGNSAMLGKLHEVALAVAKAPKP